MYSGIPLVIGFDNGTGTAHLYALDDGGTEQWRRELRTWPGTPVVAEDTVYATSYSVEDTENAGTLAAYEASSGRQQWSRSLPLAGGATRNEQTLYLPGWNAGVHAVSLDGATRWTKSVDGAVPIPPAVAGDNVYVPSLSGHVSALNASNGDERWTFETPGKVWTTPIVTANTIVVTSDDRTIYGLQRE